MSSWNPSRLNVHVGELVLEEGGEVKDDDEVHADGWVQVLRVSAEEEEAASDCS